MDSKEVFGVVTVDDIYEKYQVEDKFPGATSVDSLDAPVYKVEDTGFVDVNDILDRKWG